MSFRNIHTLLAAAALVGFGPYLAAQAAQAFAPQEIVIFDTDIGDDIDDAFALGLLLSGPDVHITGITTAWGDTTLRASLTQRFLYEPVVKKYPSSPDRNQTELRCSIYTTAAGLELRWSAENLARCHCFRTRHCMQNPGKVTLISVSPLSNIGAIIDKDPELFARSSA